MNVPEWARRPRVTTALRIAALAAIVAVAFIRVSGTWSVFAEREITHRVRASS